MPKTKKSRKHKFVDPTNKARKNIKAEIKRVTKKLDKLLARFSAGKKRANCMKKVRNEDGSEVKMVSHVRLQGIKPECGRHSRLRSYLSKLKIRFAELQKEFKADVGTTSKMK